MTGGTIRYSVLVLSILLLVTNVLGKHELEEKRHDAKHRHAYAAMMYMGTPRDYEFYVALRVMMRSLAKFQVQADRVVIASSDVPVQWVQAMYVASTLITFLLFLSKLAWIKFISSLIRFVLLILGFWIFCILQRYFDPCSDLIIKIGLNLDSLRTVASSLSIFSPFYLLWTGTY